MNLLDLSYSETEELIKELGLESYRAKQIFSAVNNGTEISDISTLSKDLRLKLQSTFGNVFPVLTERYLSSDGTEKYLFSLSDGEMIETVFMQYEHGNSVCVSTQAGCRMGCSFCASTLNGRSRDLTPGEISAQVLSAERISGKRISNIVMMGIGEPLDNYDNSVKFIRNITDERGRNISARNISLSTCGLSDKIISLADEKLPVTLSVSLHAPNDEIRNKIMPVSKRYSIDSLLTACRYYFDKTGRRISFEYSLISGVNDSDKNAAELAGLLFKYFGHNNPFHVNLIPVNEVGETGYSTVDTDRVAGFKKVLSDKGVNVTVRRRLGSDINASCGQLRYKKTTEG